MQNHKICCSCERLKPFSDYHKEKNRKDGHKDKCKSCALEVIFIKKQLVLKKRYDEGDTKVDMCSCGNYFVNEVVMGLSGKISIIERCRSCSSKTNNTNYQRRQGMKTDLRWALERLLVLSPVDTRDFKKASDLIQYHNFQITQADRINAIFNATA